MPGWEAMNSRPIWLGLGTGLSPYHRVLRSPIRWWLMLERIFVIIYIRYAQGIFTSGFTMCTHSPISTGQYLKIFHKAPEWHLCYLFLVYCMYSGDFSWSKQSQKEVHTLRKDFVILHLYWWLSSSTKHCSWNMVLCVVILQSYFPSYNV